MNIKKEEVEEGGGMNVRQSVEALCRSFDLNFESFDSESSSVILEIFGVMDEAEASQAWDLSSDPELEEVFVSMVDEIINNPSQLSEAIRRRVPNIDSSLTQSSFDQIGGQGTLRQIWAKLKELERVLGVKRKLSEND